MASGSGGSGFVLTPHKLAMCMLMHAYASPSSATPPFCALPSPARHRLALFLLHHSRVSDGFLEPLLEELGQELKDALSDVGGMLFEQLSSRLPLLSSPEELFQFFATLRELLAPVPYTTPEGVGGDDEPLLIEPNSLLGQFLRRCILAFNILSFEGTCRVVVELDSYRRPALTIARGLSIDKEDNSRIRACEDNDDLDDLDDLDDENMGGDIGMERHTSGVAAGVSGRDPTRRVFGRQAQDELMDPERPGGVRDGGFAYAFGDAASRGESAVKTRFLRTVGQVEGYLKDQASLLEKEVGQKSMAELDADLAHLEKLAPDMPRDDPDKKAAICSKLLDDGLVVKQTHYLRYLNHLHHNDYPGAMDNLHRYFDYSAGKGGLSNGGASGDASVGRFQAGLLSLGSMHAHFGHVNQAMQALNEAVRIAQQNNDDSCLAHALAALCHLLSEVGTVSETSETGEPAALPGLDIGNSPALDIQQHLLLLLRRCLRRALELKLPQLVAFSRLALAKFDLKHVRRLPSLGGLKTTGQLGTSPLEVCKTLRLSAYLLGDSIGNAMSLPSAALGNLSTSQRSNGNTQASFPPQPLTASGNMSGGGGGGWSSITGRLGPIPDSVIKLAGTSHLLRAASWELYGSSPLVRISAIIHATCYADVASADDLSLAYVKLAQHLAAFKGYSAALAALDIAVKKFPAASKCRVRAVQLQLVHDRALHRGELKLAEVACGEIEALASPIPGVDMELKIEASFCRIRTLMASDNYVEAAEAARRLFSLCYKENMQLETVLVLQLLADIHKGAGSAVTGLPYALASLTMCKSFSLDLLQASTMVTIAELWLGLGVGHAPQALDLLQQCLPMVLGHGGLELRARTNLAVAQCHLSDSSFEVESDVDAVLEPLQQAAEEFDILEDYGLAGEAYYLQALVFNKLGRIEERDESATAFQRCMETLVQNQASVIAVLPI